MSFGIVFDSISVPLCHQIPCFWVIVFFDDLLNRFLIILIKMAPADKPRNLPFSICVRDLFPHTSTFYPRKTYKCQKLRFPTFFNKLKEFIHTCTFYQRKTNKCAVTAFTILRKKGNYLVSENPNLREN